MNIEGNFDVKDLDGLRMWLGAVPEDHVDSVAVTLAARAVFRALPLLQDKGSLSSAEYIDLIRDFFRIALLAKSICLWPVDELGNLIGGVHAGVGGLSGKINGTDRYGSDSQSTCGCYVLVDAIKSAVLVLAYDPVDQAIETLEKISISRDWQAVVNDVAMLYELPTAQELHRQPLWIQDAWRADVWGQDCERLFNGFVSQTDGCEIWREWFDDLDSGKPTFGLADFQRAERLELAIALGSEDDSHDEEFWNRDLEAISLDIYEWQERAWEAAKLAAPSTKPIFISYTTNDIDQAMRIGDVISAGGYSVFAQYKDMPPGSNFVAEMQTGLATMGKFVPVYSPRYLASDHCQAEWNAAYNMDPLGKRKLIVGFLLEKTDLLPLQKQTVYVPLYGLTETQANSAILKALSAAGAERTPSQTRQAAKDYAVPVPETNAAGQLTFVPSAEVEQPFIDDDIARLPKSMLRVLGHLLAALDGPNNAPQLVTSLLRGLQSELTVNGAMAHVPDLQRDIEILLVELGRALRDGAVWADGGFGAGIEQLEKMFSSYRQNFPLVMVREIERRQAAIDPARFDDAQFQKSHDSIAAATAAMGDAGLTDASVAHVVSQRQRQRRDIESLARYVPQLSDRFVESADERTVEELKKDFMFDESGLWDRTLSRVEKVTSIADSSVGKGLMVAAREILKAIWGA